MNPIVEINHITVSYASKREVLKDVSLTVFENDFLGVIGPNGGGKTTLLRSILGLIKPEKGNITFYEKGHPVPSLNIGYLPQSNKIDKQFPIAVFDVILSGLSPSGCFVKRYTRAHREKVFDVARKLNIQSILPSAIGNLSGGQLQRVLLGRAIVDNPRVLILDEPNSYVDKAFETTFYKILQEINQYIAIILVSHDVGTILSHVKNIACVNEQLHYHAGASISASWLENAYDSCPIEIIGHGNLPHRVLKKHDCCQDQP